MEVVSKQIADYLEGQSSLGLVAGSNLFIELQPNKPNKCITLYGYDLGGVDATLENAKVYIDGLQVRSRSLSYESAASSLLAIRDEIDGLNNFVFQDTYVCLIRCISSPIVLERDENNRVNLVMNFKIQRR